MARSPCEFASVNFDDHSLSQVGSFLLTRMCVANGYTPIRGLCPGDLLSEADFKLTNALRSMGVLGLGTVDSGHYILSRWHVSFNSLTRHDEVSMSRGSGICTSSRLKSLQVGQCLPRGILASRNVHETGKLTP